MSGVANGKLGFIKHQLHAAKEAARLTPDGCSPEAHRAVVNFLAVEADVTEMMLDEFYELKALLQTFVDQRQFFVWGKKVLGIIFGSGGMLAAFLLLLKIVDQLKSAN